MRRPAACPPWTAQPPPAPTTPRTWHRAAAGLGSGPLGALCGATPVAPQSDAAHPACSSRTHAQPSAPAGDSSRTISSQHLSTSAAPQAAGSLRQAQARRDQYAAISGSQATRRHCCPPHPSSLEDTVVGAPSDGCRAVRGRRACACASLMTAQNRSASLLAFRADATTAHTQVPTAAAVSSSRPAASQPRSRGDPHASSAPRSQLLPQAHTSCCLGLA